MLHILSFSLIFSICLTPLYANPLAEDYWHQPLKSQGEAPKSWPSPWKQLNPSSCASCHQEQHQAWKHSLHAHAFSPGLYGQFSKMTPKGANACLNCHTPLAEQKFTSHLDLQTSLKSPEKNRLRNAGVSCAACHMRKWQRFGPPPSYSGETGKINTPMHGGFVASKDFENSNFCASCHQFPASWGTVNGKALENTLTEWKASRFAKEGVHCQQCHMPERKHLFKGIHDPEMTRKGLKIKIKKTKGGGILSITSHWIGHAFPTYMTPKVHIIAIAQDKTGHALQTWRWAIFRDVRFMKKWVEIADTRLTAGETRHFKVDTLPPKSTALLFRISVEPDFYYKGLYANLLEGKQTNRSTSQLKQALKKANQNDYTLFEETLQLNNPMLP